MANWERMTRMGSTNYLLQGKGFHISYNPNPGASVMGEIWGSDDGGPETALCHEGKFFILNGDYRESYEKLVPLGYEECKRFYDQQAAHAESSWSGK